MGATCCPSTSLREAGRLFRSSLTVSRFPRSLSFAQSSGPLRGCSIAWRIFNSLKLC